MAVNYRPGDEPLEGFRLQHYLGNGTFGAVWKASAPGGAEVAVKFIDLSNANGFRELKALQLIKRLRHPNIVPLMGFWLKDDTGRVLDQDQLADQTLVDTLRVSKTYVENASAAELIIVMGLGDQSLADRLAEVQAEGEHGIAAAELLKYMDDVARAIDFLNGHVHPGSDAQDRLAIQHCDIKPQNILLVGGAAQLCDLGLARMSGDTRKTRMAFTAAYGAPECFQGTTPSGTTDQYSLAISYVELRTGQLPFNDLSSPASVIQQHLASQLDLSRLTSQEQQVVQRATSQDPSQRYPTTLAFVNDLRAAVDGRFPRRAPKGRRSIAKWIVGIAALVLAGIFICVPSARRVATLSLEQLANAVSEVEVNDDQIDDSDSKEQRENERIHSEPLVRAVDSPDPQDVDEQRRAINTPNDFLNGTKEDQVTEDPEISSAAKQRESEVETAVPETSATTIEVRQDRTDAIRRPTSETEEGSPESSATLSCAWFAKRASRIQSATTAGRRALGHFFQERPIQVDLTAVRRFLSRSEANFASIALSKSNLKDAEQHVRRALNLDAAVGQTQLQAGRLMARHGQLPEATERYTRAISLDPNLQLAYRYRGITFAIQGQATRAHPDLTEALRLDPNDHVALRKRALVRLELGRYEAAIRDRIRLTTIPDVKANVILPLQLIQSRDIQTADGIVHLPPNYPLKLLTASRKELTVKFLYNQQWYTTQLSTVEVRPNAKL